ncbi:MAG: hypothetical protein R3315_13425, partial [Woeseiaceae bacterium]|nr:hypothetical protein [Woeseiaceae bacterium]
FCVADDQPAAGEDRPQTVASVLTAAASLRCASDDSEAIVYTSAPLDVVLLCQRPVPSTGDAQRPGVSD